MDAADRVSGKSAGLGIERVKALWPPFVAPKLLAWISSGSVRGGRITDFAVETDIPFGTLAELKTGGTFGPGDITGSLSFEGTSIRTAKALPRIEDASGTVHFAGTSVFATLRKGTATPVRGRSVDLAGSRVVLSDYLDRTLPSTLHVRAQGAARDLLDLGRTDPVRVTTMLGISPNDASGMATIVADLQTPLKPPPGHRIENWSARADLDGVTLKKPFKGRRIRNADLAFIASPSGANVEGVATVDGTRARLALFQPLDGNSSELASSKVALRLDAAARDRLGLSLDPWLTGPIDVELSSAADGWQQATVNLDRATIALDFADWRKGRGVPATARFRFKRQGSRTSVEDVVLTGKGFGARGRLQLDRSGVLSADMSQIRLSAEGDLSLTARRKGRGYEVEIDADRYDVRSIISAAFASASTGLANTKKSRSVPLTISAKARRVSGFSGVTYDDARARITVRSGSLASLDVDATGPRGSKSRIRLEAGEGGKLAIDSGDAGRMLKFANLYAKIDGGQLRARLTRGAGSDLQGKVRLTDFTVADEPKLAALLARAPRTDEQGGRRVQPVTRNRIKVGLASASIRKVGARLAVRSGRIRAADMAATFEGTIYDASMRMKMKGTFLPAYGLNRLVSAIPFVGLAAGNGRKRGLLGITFTLNGPWRTPRLQLNPLSVFAPGVFRKIFE